VHDGPGCRTVVFLSGCPLRCPWCANPEGLEVKPQLLFVPERCRYAQGCRRCFQACPSGGLIEGEHLGLVRERCAGCERMACTEACYSEALRRSGHGIALSELMRSLERDRRFWGELGGVTFSGGEPLQQPEFLIAALSGCRKAGIHTALETCGHADEEIFLEAFSFSDWAFVDLKLVDSSLHARWTGQPNEHILANLQALRASGWPGRLVLRMPIVPGVNEDEENARETARIMGELGIEEINLLPFHRLGESKWRQLGQAFLFRDTHPPSADLLCGLQEIYRQAGKRSYVGWDTPF
jgi:pyruvate formate lyase activating enzyme